MADNNKADQGAPGENSEECGAGENVDEEDPASENLEIQIVPALNAPPENEWYHGRLDRHTAEIRLKERATPGDYLIRESESKPGSYVLSYYGKTGINHFRITAMTGDYYIGGRQFDTLSDLIGYYTTVSYLLKGEQLISPVPPPEPVDDRRKVIAIFPYCKMQETDELSFEKGDIFVVNNEMGDGWLWMCNQRTGEEGQVYEELVEDLNGNIDPVESLPYFHPKITKDDAVDKLRQAGPNSFLVRPSDNSPGHYTLFFLCKQVVQRFKIEKVGRQLLMGGRYFDDMDSIIRRYKQEEIVEGHTLSTAVCRDSKDLPEKVPLLAKLEHKSSAEDIYAFIRSSTGPHRLMGRSDRIERTGYLQKKSNKTKKWKSYFFILNGSSRELCFFENEKRSKLKGLIDLNYSELYPVDDSFFGRPNCFQLVTNALQHYQIYYLCAENTDMGTSWINTLKEHCVNTQMTRIQKRSTVLKELRSLTVEVIESRKLPPKHLSHPYCVITLNNVKVCRTEHVDLNNIFWGETFTLDDIPGDVNFIAAKIFNHSKRSKDTEVANVTIPLQEFDNGELVDKWYTLTPYSPAVRVDMGSIRLRSRYIHQVIMPVEQYTSLKDLILNDFGNILTLADVCGSDRVSLAKALLNLFRNERQVKVLLKNINDYYIAKEDVVSTLFRSSTLATTLMDQYMKMVCTEFVHSAVKGPVCRICDSKQSCELNPQYLENQSELQSNSDHFLEFLRDMVDSIFKSADKCPRVLRYIFGSLQRTVSAKWPEDESVKTRVVSGFVFLRLLCPAIIHPKSFNLITETPSETSARALKLIAKALQNLANLVESKEQFMAKANVFIKSNKQRMVDFLHTLSTGTDCVEIQDNAVGDIARDLATIHQLCATHLDDLRKLSDSQNSVKKLIAVTDIATNHKKQYMGENT
ncbi:ras GTPase-activating protein 1-like [Mya arenaria]|uniref:ras GTPase-activating protein 1-like n=1 Tax=Mya arenaria TaxID=6604 RepID=UPI0022DF7A22|nr:ras GTPase-activating protein 1-like [Mya arenaria]